MTEILCSACGHSIDEHEKNMGCLHKVAPLAMCSCCNGPEDIVSETLKERDDRLRWWLETYDMTMPCGHKNRYLAEGENGTQYCYACKCDETRSALQPFADAYKNVFHEFSDNESLDGYDEVYVKHLHDAANVLENEQ